MDLTEFKKTEEQLLKFWKDKQIFQKSLEQRRDAKPFVFYEGPPTANGLPHIGHLLTRIFKDLYGRYQTMRGRYVLRRAGWDTHGLPVEIEIEKQLGLKNKKEIEDYGIARFNKRAKESVWKYRQEWEQMTERMGFWLDLTDPYITYDTTYIESVWHILKKIADKKLLYQGHKIVPFCTRCGTPLSSHEVAQGYKDVTETAVTVKLKIKTQKPKLAGAYLLAWTTTPWTLPGNVALAVGEKITYVAFKTKGEEGGSKTYIVAKDRLASIASNYEITQEYKGKDLVGLEYEPLFAVPALQSKTSYQVYPADFVTTTDGTGIVHTAVMYGEDDYELGKQVGLPTHHTVDEQGRFTTDVPIFAGQYVKDAEKAIVAHLKDKGLLFKAEAHLHTYPFCWRCSTPLLYYATDSWFIRMSALRKQLVKNNQQINWVPSHIKAGRFGEFIKEAKDWALSRKRYWATPLPVWQCDNKHTLVVGALADLEKYRFRPTNSYYLIRHANSTKNISVHGTAVVSSQLDQDHYDLTKEGKRQAKELARRLKKSGVDLIIASPFLRTKQTAQILSDYTGQPIKLDKRLKEIEFGPEYEGKAFPDIGPVDFTTKFPGGESRREVRARVWSLIKELEEKYQGKKIALVSHGDPLWLLLGLAKNLDEPTTLADRTKHYPKEGGAQTVNFSNYPRNDEGEIDPHRPYIDEILLKCPQCSGPMHRVVDLIDVWFDSGAMPLAQWHYPFANKKLVDSGQQYPADFIVEAIDQTRGWFYTLQAIATALGRKIPYRNVLVLGHTLDETGQKMSKSKGNVIMATTALEQFGADVTRWYLFTLSDPADGKPISPKDIESKYRGFFGTLQNTVRFLELYAKDIKITGSPEARGELDQWLYARLAQLTTAVTENLDQYAPTTAARAIEDFVISDLSNWWVRRSRPRFQHSANAEQLAYVASVLRHVLLELAKLMAPFIPFTAEWLYRPSAEVERRIEPTSSQIHQSLESIHLYDWPKVSKLTTLNLKLIAEMDEIRKLVTDGLGERKLKNLKVRQPLASVTLKRAEPFSSDLEELIKAELNIKAVSYDAGQEKNVVLDEHLTEALRREGYAREIMRQIQDLRKEAKYKMTDQIQAAWESSDSDLIATIQEFEKEIMADTLLGHFAKGHDANKVYDIEKEFEIAPGKKLWLGVKR